MKQGGWRFAAILSGAFAITDASAYTLTVEGGTDGGRIGNGAVTNGATRLVGQSSFGTQYAYGEADLSAGTLKVIALSPGAGQLQRAAAYASWSDTLNFNLSTLTTSDFVTIAIRASVEGTYEAGSQPNFNFYASTGGLFYSDDLAATVGYRATSLNTVFSAAVPEIFLQNGRSGDFVDFGPAAFYGFLTLQGGGVRSVNIGMGLGGDSSVQFGNTAHFNVLTDLTFVSDSGVFQSTPVPLPAAGWLLLSALGGLSTLAKRRTSVPEVLRDQAC